MRRWKLFILTALILGTTAYTGYAATKQPLLVVGSQCSGGGNAWDLYEDKDGDGSFDYVFHSHCDGTWSSGPFNVSAPDSTYTWQFPTGIASTYTLTTSLQSNGLYNWGIQVNRYSDNALIGSVYRSGSTVTCSIEDDFLQ